VQEQQNQEYIGFQHVEHHYELYRKWHHFITKQNSNFSRQNNLSSYTIFKVIKRLIYTCTNLHSNIDQLFFAIQHRHVCVQLYEH
jgi:hypothetical protein